MATKEQAAQAFQLAHGYYKGGWKSSNKLYNSQRFGFVQTLFLVGNTGLELEAAKTRIDNRNINQARSKHDQLASNFRGTTPIKAGDALCKSGSTAGNCGQMAAVAMSFAAEVGVAETDMWLVTLRNANTMIYGGPMAFAHSYAELGTEDDAGGPFVVDPWANINCSLADYPEMLKAKLNKWHAQGKRIAVDCPGVNPMSYWTNANDDAILSLLALNRHREAIPGNGIIGA